MRSGFAHFGKKNRGSESCCHNKQKDKLHSCTLQAAKKATLFVGSTIVYPLYKILLRDLKSVKGFVMRTARSGMQFDSVWLRHVTLLFGSG